MDHMNDFFGKPLFQPTGSDWIDHAFTAAVLDELESESESAKTRTPAPPVSSPPKLTPEVEAALMKDPEYRKCKQQLEEGAAEIDKMIQRAQRRWF